MTSHHASETPTPYKDLAERLVAGLRLETPPVAVLFSSTPPPGVAPLDGQLKACEMIEAARIEGRVFTTALEHQHCKGSCYFLGFEVTDEFIANWSSGDWQAGEFPDRGRSIWKTPAAHRRTIPDFSMLPRGSVRHMSYGPLAHVPFDDGPGGIVVVVVCTPKQGMYLARMATWASGGAVTGITGPGTCSPILAGPLTTGKMIYSLGCFGIRQYMKVRTEDLLIGFPVEMLPELVENLESFLKKRWDMDAVLDEPVGVHHEATEEERGRQRPDY